MQRQDIVNMVGIYQMMISRITYKALYDPKIVECLFSLYSIFIQTSLVSKATKKCKKIRLLLSLLKGRFTRV